MSALAVRNEDSPLTETQILEPEPEHLAAPQTAQAASPGPWPGPRSVRSAAMSGLDLAEIQDPRQAPHTTHKRCATFTSVPVAPGGQATRHRVGDDADIAADDQIAIEADTAASVA